MILPLVKDKKNDSSLETMLTLPKLMRTLFVNVIDIEVDPGRESALFQSLAGYQRFLHIDIRSVSLEHRLFHLNPLILRLFFSDVEYCALV